MHVRAETVLLKDLWWRTEMLLHKRFSEAERLLLDPSMLSSEKSGLFLEVAAIDQQNVVRTDGRRAGSERWLKHECHWSLQMFQKEFRVRKKLHGGAESTWTAPSVFTYSMYEWPLLSWFQKRGRYLQYSDLKTTTTTVCICRKTNVMPIRSNMNPGLFISFSCILIGMWILCQNKGRKKVKTKSRVAWVRSFKPQKQESFDISLSIGSSLCWCFNQEEVLQGLVKVSKDFVTLTFWRKHSC